MGRLLRGRAKKGGRGPVITSPAGSEMDNNSTTKVNNLFITKGCELFNVNVRVLNGSLEEKISHPKDSLKPTEIENVTWRWRESAASP
ncbi:hypothetical protein NPIL_76301 [Nephila pilipes]|uniref:Uncharacterized protein n=1 Tax=Nephila pilipes TaxID=299642 RepID=A0A8X6NPK0_NEPPI|nr:hypothetical protein NPIL_76301 [Nephila pilipes]